MEKVISLRPTNQIMTLFSEIKEIDTHLELDRSAIVKRALQLAFNNTIDWQIVAKVKIGEGKITPPDHIRFTIEGEQYQIITEQIRDAFSLQRVTAPYLIRLVLTNYLLSLKTEDKEKIITTVEERVELGIDCLVFKNSYDISDYNEKERILLLARKYLENYNIELNRTLRKQMDSRIKEYSDYFDREKYFPKPRSNFGTCDIRFISKSFAGLLLTLVETGVYEMEEIIQGLESVLGYLPKQ